MFSDQLQVELHWNFDPTHVDNKKVELDKLENKKQIELNQNNKVYFVPPPETLESLIINFQLRI
jgi:hypothetical protein